MKSPILISWNASPKSQREDTEEAYLLPYLSSVVPKEPMRWRCRLNVAPGCDVFLVRRGENVANRGVMGWGTVVSAKDDDGYIGIDWAVLLIASRRKPHVAALGINPDAEFTRSARTAMPFATWRLLSAHRERFEELNR